ncbi:hypothetical protein HII36_26075 [Nonomuraea sp. NN258]|uniref:AfsR/SARP family transcriptional regulator n=1 Tax=Nonomuraea antri TaxID=2730852 RepID=UPI001569149E|nr:BTAD domain-containing putative transcriptional regulator [Nonomuraea antri]NRQ35266.1 hypothetical protein [Nonomuraea antri]
MSDDGREIRLGPAKQRSVLAMLLSDAGEVVLGDQLVDGLWGAAAPPGARGTLHSYIARLRGVLHAGGVELERHAGGYLLPIEPERVDLHRFLRLVDEAQVVHEGRQATALLHEALDLCRHEPLAGLPGPWAAGARVRLGEVRVAAALRYHEIQLDSGHAERVVARIHEMAPAHLLDERLAAQLMTALCRCGRQVAAVRVYEEFAEHLESRLGVTPGPELRTLLQQILLAHPESTSSKTTRAPGGGGPFQLPAALADFVGREPALRELSGHLLAGREHGVGMAVISGPAGVGKSALAVHAAHRLRDAFPDGQLYVDLHGLDPRPADPAAVLERFLRALNVDHRSIPDGLEPRAEMYRALLAGRRMVVVLDGAAGEAQIQPLLPGTPGCAVVVTSRYRLAGLPGAGKWHLGMLTRDQALELLSRIVGHERVSREPEPSAALIERCAGLPLAVRIAGARLAARPHWPVRHLVGKLSGPRRCLDELSHGPADVRAALAAAYRLLDAPARHLFRLLGLVEARPFPASVAAALVGAALPAVHDTLARLVDLCLLDASADDAGEISFEMHELTRAYARERAMTEDPALERTRALARVPSHPA